MSEKASLDADGSPLDGGQSNARRRRSDRMVVASGEFQHAIDLASGLSRSKDSVVFTGPKGSGRRHLARAFHGWSPQAPRPLVELAVAGLTEGDQSKAIYGSSEGPGALKRAEGGTLLILEADLLSPGLQTKIADALRSEQIGAGGDDSPPGVGARIIATASEGVEPPFPGAMTKSIMIPGLDQRQEDLLPLAAHFLAEFTAEKGLDPIGFTADASTAISGASWPGQVRELRARIRQAVELSGTGAISVESLMLASEVEEVMSFKEAKRAFETRYVEGLLRRCSGNISRAARLAKKDRKDFYDVIRRTGVEPGHFRS
jgi:two-component system, NtrC family, response regulator GlrR